jgi:iron complex transport system substrate-binding protein
VRVVSLLSSCTEWVCTMGAERLLVGRSHECDFPSSVARLPRCSRPLIDVDAGSAEIDRQVKERRRNALSIYEVDEALLRELRPDVVLTQTQCDVCAVSLADVETALGRITGCNTRVVSVHPTDLESVFEDGRRIARALGIDQSAEVAIAALKERLADLTRSTARLLSERTQHGLAAPRVLCLEWIDPPMASGNWMPELVATVSATLVGGEAGRPSPWITHDEIASLDPDEIVILPCGWDVRRAERELGPLANSPAWRSLRAVRSGRVSLADGNQFFNRPGPRLIESAELLAEIVWSQSRGQAPHWRRIDAPEWDDLAKPVQAE